ncbi:hypothetical protein D7S86_04870 [Pararobbsia silviterrae]|uniref:Uncharacterized protein n=2 Tax=Pararobbsia silviterrae TaxID=1792498 RepID=A0A494YES8_9BURK|nr:hypothetical protein D7S86_04870 [Pararobbsia silviterrae]
MRYLELLDTPRPMRSMRALKQAGVLVPDATVSRVEGENAIYGVYVFDIVMRQVPTDTVFEFLSSDRGCSELIDACLDAMFSSRRETLGVDAVHVVLYDDPHQIDWILSLHDRDAYVLDRGRPCPIVARIYSCAPLLKILASDAGLTSWLARGFFPLFPTGDQAFFFLERLVNFAYSNVQNESDFLSEGLYVPYSIVRGSTYAWPLGHLADLTGVEAYGADIDFEVLYERFPTRRQLVAALSEAGVVGLDADACIELPCSDPNVCRIRLNQKPSGGTPSSN